MTYCTECGTKLELKFLEDEGMIPYCNSCEMYRFKMFNVAVSMIVKNSKDDQILLIQQYNRPNNILVAGYVNHGEDAEDAVVREIQEEVGLKATNIKFNRSSYFDRSNTLLLNFSCNVEEDNFVINPNEVDAASWFPLEDALDVIAPNSLAQRFLQHYFNTNK